MSKEVCGGNAPWKCSSEVAKAMFGLMNLGALPNSEELRSLSDEVVIDLYQSVLAREYSLEDNGGETSEM